MVILAPLVLVVAEKSPRRSAAVGMISLEFRVWTSWYVSPATQKNVRFFTIGPPKPPPPR